MNKKRKKESKSKNNILMISGKNKEIYCEIYLDREVKSRLVP
jgi:hypothetical protein